VDNQLSCIIEEKVYSVEPKGIDPGFLFGSRKNMGSERWKSLSRRTGIRLRLRKEDLHQGMGVAGRG